ncbi:MAG TPA: dTDP-glucose 4,6-dehydratase [Blastocatellia bacterium]|nr:dTDP-glucose 4,6-dehydratase [Blastocatellia bacterium]
METMIVTGGAGFIGVNFVKYALEHSGDRVVILDKLTYAGNSCTLAEFDGEPRVVFEQADIGDRKAVDGVFQTYLPSCLLNFAAETHVDRSIDDPRPFIHTNINGTFELLETARRYCAEHPLGSGFRFLHVSTDEVYGTLGETGCFSETTPYAPNSPYSASKAAADHLVRAYHETYGLKTIVTNCSNNYGPYQFPEKLIPLTIMNAVEGKPLPIYGDGGNIRDWLYVEDHCSGILTVLKNGRPGDRYNIGGGNERTNVQVVDAICQALEEILPAAGDKQLAERGAVHYSQLKKFVADRPGHDRRYAIDATKIGSELGWRARHGFEMGIKDTVRWYLDHRNWCQSVLAVKYERQRLGGI